MVVMDNCRNVTYDQKNLAKCPYARIDRSLSLGKGVCMQHTCKQVGRGKPQPQDAIAIHTGPVQRHTVRGMAQL